ncbi:MAG: 4-hydroxy-tetrahydrodipicolinate synthase [Flavobacteriales bacterium]|nr:4-hydroxy-tetrahydrodipicolinate synthase [Flavobacteriaceae bacterium]MDO7581812.1 4-hydroxy-tetrahydrodipicolinate synthase [Flavobacteriaceae bacterium]MDO7591378.1 4-hydroxy-tetrahydrodipicolinate synthase [Flavobacteriaceae bacterium]MDO7599218.1 4-hydroxy-tetrahydrodipicolinate synthase [Flavobacteriaceae bacterium]MDO7602885.1 4-hydroxy-tetrahydrodipicolinate synthase [Flavobacteriaceae bacterium]
MKFLRGSGVAMITPFNKEGEVDYDAVVKVVDHIISGGIDYIVVMGTTAETATLFEEERSKVVSLIVETTNNRVPLVLGIGGNNTASVVSKIKLTDLSSFKAILSVCPYYTKPSQEGIYQHYKNIANASSIPLILYNVPSRSGVSIENETTVRLANDFSNIIGTKDASGDLESVLELLGTVPDGFHVISGDDLLALPIVLAGGSGVISVIGGGLPTQVSQMIHLGLEDKIDQASEYHNQMLEMIDLIFKEGNPTGIKNLSEHIGLCESKVRLPLVAATDELSSSILSAYRQI